jgi:hypothetical protein
VYACSGRWMSASCVWTTSSTGGRQRTNELQSVELLDPAVGCRGNWCGSAGCPDVGYWEEWEGTREVRAAVDNLPPQPPGCRSPACSTVA